MRRRQDAGSAAAELVIVTPIFLAFLAAFLTGGQLLLARQDANDAARGAVEAAVAEPTAALAAKAASATARSDLAGGVPNCGQVVVKVDTARFVPGGYVSVEVSCSVALPGIPFASLPARVTVTARSSAVIAPYRAVLR